MVWSRILYLCILACLWIGVRLPLIAVDLFCENQQEQLMQDLLVVDYWNQYNSQRLPVTYNQFLQGGYFIMPSARMGEEGEVQAGYSYVPPYRNYNLRLQLLDRLEVTANYRIFKNMEDPVLGPLGFGDFSDKGLNTKFCLFSPEDSKYELPGLAIGFDDMIGTRAFKAYYIVLTQVLLNYNMEITLGYGRHRLKGFFGGMLWMPFRDSCNEYWRGLSLGVEYDATPYRDPLIEKHPDGRVKRNNWNFGIKYRLWDTLDITLAYIRGDAVTVSVSAYFNFGSTQGIVPKIEDPLPYKAPINTQELGYLRPEDTLAQDLVFAFRSQGFDIMKLWLSSDNCGDKILRIQVVNCVYREECHVRQRLNALLSALIPNDIDEVIVVVAVPEMPLQEYRYSMFYLREYQMQQLSRYELNILTPLSEVTTVNPYQSKLLFKKNKELWNITILPKTHFLFGSAKGKFKFAAGLSLAMNGYLFDDIFYCMSLGYFAFSNLYDLADVDRLNPSQLINVRTDVINYYKQKSITLDEAYMQKVTNLGCGWYSRCGIGLFEVEYGGVVGEILYYPVNSWWAVGVESAILKKRTVDSFGFTDKARKLEGFKPTYVKFFPSQFFFNFYYDWKTISLQFKISAGKFLAYDYGVRYEIYRYFPSGFRVGLWYTYTNAHDFVNGQRYQDKGVFFSIPLDLFYTCSSRIRWGYGMSAWLRDVGVRAFTGPDLYNIINENRQ